MKKCLPQDHAQLFDVNSCLALQVFSKHFALEVDLLQPVFQVHDALKGRDTQEGFVRSHVRLPAEMKSVNSSPPEQAGA